jgi:Ni/Co efflux regulator RcnB
MTKLISMIVAALFAAVSVSALAADAPAKGDKMEKSDGKMDKKDDGKKAAHKKAAPKKAAPKKAAPKMEEKK